MRVVVWRCVWWCVRVVVCVVCVVVVWWLCVFVW